MFQQEVEELFFLQSDWCLHCCVMVGGDHWWAFKSGEAKQDERGAEANSLSILSFYPTQESFGSQADASICSSFTPRPIRQVKLHLQRTAQKQWFLLLLGPCISDISLHLGRRRKRESAPQAFLRGRTASYVLCSGFGNWGVFLQVAPQILGYGTWPTNPKEARCLVPQMVPPANPVELRIFWTKIFMASMQPNARQVLLGASLNETHFGSKLVVEPRFRWARLERSKNWCDGDRSLIEGCLACELHLKGLVAWVNRARTIAIDESQLSCYSNLFMNTCSQTQGFPFDGVRFSVSSSSTVLEFSNCRFVWAQQAVVYRLVFTSQARAVSHRPPQTAALKFT